MPLPVERAAAKAVYAKRDYESRLRARGAYSLDAPAASKETCTTSASLVDGTWVGQRGLCRFAIRNIDLHGARHYFVLRERVRRDGAVELEGSDASLRGETTPPVQIKHRVRSNRLDKLCSFISKGSNEFDVDSAFLGDVVPGTRKKAACCNSVLFFVSNHPLGREEQARRLPSRRRTPVYLQRA